MKKNKKKDQIISENKIKINNKSKIKMQPFSKMIGRKERENEEKLPEIGYYSPKLDIIYPKIKNIFFYEKKNIQKINKTKNKININISNYKINKNSILFNKMLGRSKGIQWYKNYTENENNVNKDHFLSIDNTSDKCKVPNFKNYLNRNKNIKKKINLINNQNYDPNYDYINKNRVKSINFNKLWSRKYSYLNLSKKKVINNKYYFKI